MNLFALARLLLISTFLTAPAAAFDVQFSTVPGRVPGVGGVGTALTNGEIALNRADKRLIFRNIDGTIGSGSLLDAVAAGRRLVQTGAADDATVGGVTLPSALGGKAPIASPAFTGVVTAPSLTITGAGSTGPVDGMTTTLPGAAAASLRDLFLSRAPLGKREINAADTRYASGMVSDCTPAGTGTDNAPMLRAARDAWIAAGAGAMFRVPPGSYCLGSSVDMNLNGLIGMMFDASQAVFVLKNTPMVGFDFHNGQQAVIKARFVDGGVFNSASSSPYSVDYGAVADVVAAGGQEAIRVSGISGYTVDLFAQNYAGRLLRVTRARNGEVTTGGLKGTIRTTRGNSLSKPRTAQSLFIDNGNNGYTSYAGHLDSLHDDFAGWGPGVYDVNDFAINYFDGAYAFTGVTLGGVGVFKGGIIYVGDVDSNPSNVHFAVVPSPFTGRLSSFVSMDQLAMLNTGKGLVVTNTDPSGRGVDIRQVLMGGNGCDTVVTLSNVKGANLGIDAQAGCQTAAVVNGAASDDIRLTIKAKALLNTFAYVAPEVTGNVQVGGNLVDPAPGYSGLVVAGDTPVRLSEFDVVGNTGAALVTLQSATNKTRWVSGSKTGSNAALYGSALPSYVGPSVAGVTPGYTFAQDGTLSVPGAKVLGSATMSNPTAPGMLEVGSSNGGNYDDTLQFRTSFVPTAGSKITGQIAAAPDTGSGGRLVFRTLGTGGTRTEAFRVDALQRVGIGTETPLEKLDVVGNIKGSGTGVFGGALMVGGQLAANQTQKAILDYYQTDRSVRVMAYSHDGTAANIGFWAAAANGRATRTAFLDASGNLSLIGGFAVFNKAKVTTAPTVPAAATDAASTQALANALRAALISYGLVQ